MASKISFVPFDEDREEQKIEEKAERRRLRNAPLNDNAEDPEFDPSRFGRLNPRDAEFASIEDFVECLCDDDTNTFNHEHLACLEFRLNKAVWIIRKELEAYGLKLAKRGVERHIRTFSTNPNDRWQACPSHGGGGGSSIQGYAD